ncbi:MAG: adenylate/guanylate cyclase domain-containing protein [Pseudomonadales bacterium]
MRIRGLQARARPFRYAGFWLTAGVCLLLTVDGTGHWRTAAAGVFCVLWPLLADRALRRLAPGGGRGEWLCYVGECSLTALVLTWAALPALPALNSVLWLIGGAAALAGWPLAVASAISAALGVALAAGREPITAPSSITAADVAALLMLAGFVLALALQSFRQAQRLDAQRLALAERSAELERVNQRLQRYLPTSLRDRVRRAPEEPWRWERRWLTVVFIDLAGFTRLAERLDAESLAALVDDYIGALVPAVEARGGEVSKLLGDGVLAVFGCAERRPDEGAGPRRERAVRALTLCREVPGLLDAVAARWRDRGEQVELAMRAGVASGLCTLGDRGGEDRLDFTLIGTPVNLASRLQARAALNGLLLDEATGLLCAGGHAVGPRRLLDIDGIGRVATYAPALTVAVDRPHPSAMVPAPSPPLDAAADGQGVSAGLPG